MTTYLLYAAGHRLQAPSLAELAELVWCAIDANDPIDGARVTDPRERRLSEIELVRLLGHVLGQRVRHR